MSPKSAEGSFMGRLLSGRSLAAALAVGVATFFAAPSTSKAAYEYEAAYYSYYGFLYSYYAVVYEDFYEDNFHNQANYFGQFGYQYSNMGYEENDKTWFYYGFQYNGFAYSYMYQAYALHGGTYTNYSAEAFRSALAYSYIAYYE